MSENYQNRDLLSSVQNATDIRRFGPHRRSQAETLACRRMRQQYGLAKPMQRSWQNCRVIVGKKTNKERYSDRYVQIKGWELNSPAFRALNPNEVRIYLEMRAIYRGDNNGKIHMSTRRAGKLCHKTGSTGKRALDRLKALGFIKVRRNSSFDQKRYAREYELTAISMKPTTWTSSIPNGTKEFMKLSRQDIINIDAALAKNIPSKKTKHSATSGGHSATCGELIEQGVRLHA